MKATTMCSVLSTCFLVSCGGGTPYTGLWQCETDSTSSLEVSRFEDYFLITARHKNKEVVREGSYKDDAFQVGANNVGQSMVFELRDAKLTCTNPPNFCRCDGSFVQVDALTPYQVVSDEVAQPSADKATSDYAVPDIQILRQREPLTLELANGGSVLLFDHYANEDIEQRMFDWPKLTYYYLPQLNLLELGEGARAEVHQQGNEVSVNLKLSLRKIDQFELMEKIYESINTKIQRSHVLPLHYEQLTVSLNADSQTVQKAFEGSSFSNEQDGTEISIPVTIGVQSEQLQLAKRIVAAINDGSYTPEVTIVVDQTSAAGEILAADRESVSIDWPVVR